MNCPPQQVFPSIWENVAKFMQNSDGGHRKAAMMAIAASAEGCSDYIRNEFKLENVVPVVLAGLKDAHIPARRAACMAMAALANDMGSEISDYHASILPLVFDLLNDNNEHIRKVSLETVDTLLENLGENIKPYLTPLMERLMSLLDSSDNEAKATIVSAIGSAAHAAGEVRKSIFSETGLIFSLFNFSFLTSLPKSKTSCLSQTRKMKKKWFCAV
jgi:hypothetical protein